MGIEGTFKLVKFDGAKVPAEHDINMTLKKHGDADEYQFGIRVANTMGGTIKGAHGVYKGNLMGTMMMGTEYQMGIEHAISLGFGSDDGMKMTVEGDKVTLSHGDKVLVFQKA